MIVTASFLLGIIACGLRSARACLFVGAALMAFAGAGGDWIEALATIGAYNMGLALMLCGAIAIDRQRDQQ
ncbi:hypothetical protein MZK49_24275 [Ensifer sesbaniae]|jgi:hypothetical protein|uniref:hypothetical protein n=1 Tax=Ensifer sesbaniae TaxID=1214071 RepID=UPI002000DB76|nr:hypothetical protein [Ensifer sesbaniae]